MRIVDAFAGIGGIRLSFESAAAKSGLSCECVSAIEWDKDSRATYAANHGHEPQFSDITAIGDMSVLPDHDVLLGGFPCQVFSRNGKFYNKNDRTLGDDDRKNLVTYLFAVLKAKRPRAFLFENVKEMLTIKNVDGSSFFGTVEENVRDLGYWMTHAVLDAKDFGLPQQRKRVYMVGFSLREDLERFEFPPPWRERGFFDMPLPQGTISCVRDVLQPDVGDEYLLERLWARRKNVRLPGMRLEALRAAYDGGKWAREQAIRVPTPEILPVAIVYGDTPSGLPRQQDKLYSTWGVSPTIATFSTPPFDVDGRWRLLTPRECARLQGLPEEFRLPKSDTLAYHQIGNGIAVNVVRDVAAGMLGAMGGVG